MQGTCLSLICPISLPHPVEHRSRSHRADVVGPLMQVTSCLSEASVCVTWQSTCCSPVFLLLLLLLLCWSPRTLIASHKCSHHGVYTQIPSLAAEACPPRKLKVGASGATSAGIPCCSGCTCAHNNWPLPQLLQQSLLTLLQSKVTETLSYGAALLKPRWFI